MRLPSVIDMNIKAKLYVTAVSLLGLGVIGMSLYRWHSEDVYRFCFYLILSALAAGLKVNLPGIRGTMPVCFLFVFIGIADLKAPETLILGCVGTVAQCLWKSKHRPKLFQAVFSIANRGIAVTLAYSFYHWPVLQRFEHIGPLLPIATGLVYYLLNTVPIAEAISLSDGKRFGETWHNCYFRSFPFYLTGASLAWIISLFTRRMQWQGSIALLPVIYLIYRSYQLYLARLEDERRHVESIAWLHMRTIEAPALAIEAKDHTTRASKARRRLCGRSGQATGYPYGLLGEEIPIGARILSAVDCLDALASDRQYRRAMGLEQAMNEVVALAGKSFDPRVVLILRRHYVELERLAQATPENTAKLSTDVRIDKGSEPAAGYQGAAPHTAAGNEYDFLCLIAAARQEVQLLFELVQDLGNSLSLDETLSVVAARLKKIVPYDAIPIYVRLDRKQSRSMSTEKTSGCSPRWRYQWEKVCPAGWPR